MFPTFAYRDSDLDTYYANLRHFGYWPVLMRFPLNYNQIIYFVIKAYHGLSVVRSSSDYYSIYLTENVDKQNLFVIIAFSRLWMFGYIPVCMLCNVTLFLYLYLNITYSFEVNIFSITFSLNISCGPQIHSLGLLIPEQSVPT